MSHISMCSIRSWYRVATGLVGGWYRVDRATAEPMPSECRINVHLKCYIDKSE